MHSTISIEQLEIVCIVGILAHERKLPQKILLDVELDLNLEPVLQSKSLTHSADYAEIADFLTRWIVDSQFELLETLAFESCTVVLQKWPSVDRCKITVKKPSAIPNAKYASVTLAIKRQ